MRERALTVFVFALLAALALAWQSYGLPDLWLADEITTTVGDMLARRSFDPRHFMYPSLMVDVCYALARLLGVESSAALGHLCRSVSAGFYLLSVFAFGRAVEVVLEKRVPFAYFFVGTIGALVHHAHIATVNSCFFFTIGLALLQFVRTLRSRKERDFYLSVLACSLATGAKYNGVFLFGVLPVLWLATFREIKTRRFLRALLVSVAIAPLPFLLTTPYCLLDWETFHKQWHELTQVEAPAFVWDLGVLGYLEFFFSYSLAFFTPVGAALVLLWSAAGLREWRRRAGALAVIGSTFLLYFVMNWKIGILQSRYYLPLAPILSVWFLVALHELEAPRARRATIALLLVLGAANAWANAASFHLAAKAQALSHLEPLAGRIGVIACPARRPYAPGTPLDERTDTFTTDLGDQDVATFDEYLSSIERFFMEKKPRSLVLEGIQFEWTVFRPARAREDYGARIDFKNPGREAWERHLERAGYTLREKVENCEGPLAMRWLLGSYYLRAAEGVGRPVYIYERREGGR